MTVSTADCKQFLATQFPDVSSKDWKRVNKFKGTDGFPVREFSHPSHDTVFVVEQPGGLQLRSDAPARANQASNKAAKYVYSLVPNEDKMGDDESDWVLMITQKSFWQNNGCMNDQPDYTPADLMPEEWMADDVNEGGTWLTYTKEDKLGIITIMENLGFQSDATFDAFINGSSGKTFADYLAIQQQAVLNEAVGSDTANDSSKKHKI